MNTPFPRPGSLPGDLDPRARILGAGALTLGLAATSSVMAALIGCALALLTALCSQIAPRHIASRLKTVGVFLVFLWITLPLTYGGRTIDLWGISFSKGGSELAVLITIKSLAILTLFITLVGTTSFTALSEALRRLGLPPKMCWLLLFSYRYLSDIRQEYRRLRRAAMLRGFVPKTDLRTYQVYANMLGMTLVRTWGRSQKISQAMMLRGFHGRFYSLAPVPAFRFKDVIFSSLAVAASLGLALCSRLP